MDKLNNIIENPANYGLRKNMLVYDALRDLINYGTVHTVVVYRGRFKGTTNDFTQILKIALNKAGVKYIEGNDAPRGGKTGKFIEIDVKSFKPAIRDIRN